MVVPKNAPNKAAAFKYMNALLEPSAQQGFAAHMGYLPTVDDAPLSGKVGEQLALSRARNRNWSRRTIAVISKSMADLNDWWLKNIQHELAARTVRHGPPCGGRRPARRWRCSGPPAC